MLHNVYTLDFYIKFKLLKFFLFKKKEEDILVFLIFLRVKINEIILIESNSKFKSLK